MDVKLVLLMNCLAIVYCQETSSCRNDGEWQKQFFEDLRYEIDSICQLSCTQPNTGVCIDNQEIQEMKSEIQDIRQIVSDQKQLLETFRDKWNEIGICHSGFTYLPASKSCYKVVYESHNWTSAAQKCQKLRHGSHLVAITSAEENEALKTFIATEISKNSGNTACIPRDWPDLGNAFWTCGQRLIESNCTSPFVWKPSSDEKVSFEFASWAPGQPDCYEDEEFCLHLSTKENFGWNDQFCTRKMCPLCEYKP